MSTNQELSDASVENADFELCLAPVRGITDHVYRTAVSQLFGGLNRAVAPFIKTSKTGPKKNTFSDLNPEKNQTLRVTPQLIGKNSDDFIRYATELSDMGYREVNWNLGCPHPVVTQKGMGAALLQNPQDVNRFLEGYFSADTPALSVKTRLGLDNPTELVKLLPVLNDYPLSELIIHPRTARQMYAGEVNDDMFHQCADLSRAPVMYSGEINTPMAFEKLQRKFPLVDKWMLGRGFLSNPFLANQIRGHQNPDTGSAELLQALHDQLYREYSKLLSGPSHILSRMKAHLEYLLRDVEVDDRLLKSLSKTTHLGAYESLVKDVITVV